MRKSLKYHFMNPYQKWKAKGHFPWKLLLQLIKIVLVTVQLAVFGLSRASNVEFMEKNSVALRHIFLKDWAASYETMPYPPTSGPYALYRRSEFYKHVDFAMEQFDGIEVDAIGTYSFTRVGGYIDFMTMCKTRYVEGEIDAFNQTYKFNSEVVTVCFGVEPLVEKNETGHVSYVYDSRRLLKLLNETVNFDRTLSLALKFSLKTIHLRSLTPTGQPDCFQFNVTILYENEDHDGALGVSLSVDEIPLPCDGKITSNDPKITMTLQIVFDCIVIVICALSAILCVRTMFRLIKVARATENYFKTYRNHELSFADKLEFVDLFYVIFIVNDALTIAGSIFKIQMETKTMYDYEVAGLLLGTGSLFVWLGVLHYLTFFQNYNILIFTLKRCLPNVLRFLVCATVLYMGFTFCGWVVLGPYHIKFRRLSSTSECLFAMINGDDMYVTFTSLQGYSNEFVWWYSRFYLYTFIALFIYVVLSVFISIIMEAYESVKHYHQHGYPKSELYEFIEGEDNDPSSSVLEDDDHFTEDCCFLFCPKLRPHGTDEERTKLLR